nr:hypothetical protein [uncultured Carboxylicivirga sp.]
MKLYVFLILLIALQSCYNKKRTTTSDIDFFSNEISKYYGTRKILDINIKFSECGEWGGHEENIFITTGNDEYFRLHYQKYKADCDKMVLIEDSIGTYYGPFKELEDSCTFIMNQNHKNLIYKFSHNIFSAKFREGTIHHAGNIFNLKKYQGFSGSEFNIHVYGFDSLLVKDYKQLLEGLNLPIINKEGESKNRLN